MAWARQGKTQGQAQACGERAQRHIQAEGKAQSSGGKRTATAVRIACRQDDTARNGIMQFCASAVRAYALVGSFRRVQPGAERRPR
eukprot:656599-Alexandrium_andersonii.AAC.1